MPSEAARRLQVPANVMHYRVRRLLEAGLLEVADDNGRSRTYAAQTFSISAEVLPALTEALPAMLDAMLSKLHCHALQSAEKKLRDLETLVQQGPFTFDLSEQFSVRPNNRYTNEINI